jgi:methyl-accepting chemotaxis protein
MAIAQMDEVTQQNAALVEEAAATAGSLQDQATSLARVVSIFNIGNAQGRQAGHPAAARPTARTAARPVASKPQRLSVANGAAADWEEF